MNFYDVFKPLYFLLSIHGLFPYSVKFIKNKHFTILKRSIYLNSLCAVSIVIILLLFGILHVIFIYTSNKDSTMIEGSLTKINYVVEVFTLIIFCVVTYISFFFCRYEFVKILNKITILIESTADHEEYILKKIRHVIKSVIAFLPLPLIISTVINFTRRDSLWKMILVMFNCMITQTIQFVVIGYYYIFFKIVIFLLDYIKEIILKITNDEVLIRSIIKIEPKCKITLRRLERTYVEVLEMKQAISDVFQAPLFMSMIQSFHSLVSQSYIIYHGMVFGGSMTTHDFINCSSWLPYQILKIYALAHTGHSLKIQIKTIGQVLHNIPAEKDDIKLLMKIQHFSSLMRYHGDELSVYGFFPLDATLMFKVIASATMYLIILVQFDKKNNVV